MCFIVQIDSFTINVTPQVVTVKVKEKMQNTLNRNFKGKPVSSI